MKDKNKTKRIALCGVVSALALVLMLLAGVLPTSSYALAALSGVVLILVIAEFGAKTAVSAFFCVAIMSFFFVADKEVMMLFVCFLGWYPIAKGRLDRIKPWWAGYLCRFAIFAAAVTVFYFSVTRLFGIQFDMDEGLFEVGLGLMIGMVIVAFFTYDIAISKLFEFYDLKLRQKLHRILYS